MSYLRPYYAPSEISPGSKYLKQSNQSISTYKILDIFAKRTDKNIHKSEVTFGRSETNL